MEGKEKTGRTVSIRTWQGRERKAVVVVSASAHECRKGVHDPLPPHHATLTLPAAPVWQQVRALNVAVAGDHARDVSLLVKGFLVANGRIPFS